MFMFVLLAGCADHKEDSLDEFSIQDSSEDPDAGQENDSKTSDETEEIHSEFIYVYVCGAVNHPDVYELPQGARIIEAIKAAGGFREDAAEEALNLAALLTDGMQICVLTQEEAESVDSQISAADTTETSDGKININTASQEELMSLPGIGEAKAGSIIAYREANGGFAQIDELMQVEGIKEGVFNKIADLITVG